ncbi:MAG: YeeE/YedE family protein [Ahrensia sp.]
MEFLTTKFDDGALLFALALLVGVLFGAAAQHSRFCLRSATIEFSSGSWGKGLSIWLVAFLAAVACVQLLISRGYLDVSQARQLAATGSLSGAIIGGLMFGVGMILARGCASRLLILSATGNLRALVTGLVLTLTAQASLRGGLSPAREALSELWTVSGGEGRNLLTYFQLNASAMAVFALAGLALAVWFAHSSGTKHSRIFAAIIVGLAVGLGWLGTYQVAQASFEIVPISSVTFTGPSADTLMGLVNSRSLPLSFGSGLVPGVFIGAMAMAAVSGEAKIQRFEPDTPMERYLLGGVLMGFGSMLAGGCAVGAGMSGGAIFAMTAWVALTAMWVGASITNLMMNMPSRHAVQA